MKSVYIPDKQVSIAVPEDYIVYAKDDQDIDSRLVSIGITKESLQDMMQQNRIVLTAYNPDLKSDTINAGISDSAIEDLNLLDQDLVQKLLDRMVEELSNVGFSVTGKEVLSINDMLMISTKSELTANPNQKNIQYFTIYDHQTIVITMTVYDGIITPEDEALLKTAVECSSLKKGK